MDAAGRPSNHTVSRLARDLHAVPRYDWHVSTRIAHVSPSGEAFQWKRRPEVRIRRGGNVDVASL